MEAENLWLGALVAAAVAIPALFAVIVDGDGPPRQARPDAGESSAAVRKRAAIKAFKREATKASAAMYEPYEVGPKVAAACGQKNSWTLPSPANARLFLANYQGDEPDYGDGTVNRVVMCLYATGRKTELGFNDVVEGETVSMADGAGDYVIYVSSLWMAADGVDEGVYVWNARTGERVYGLSSCATGYSDCGIQALAVTAQGSYAYINGRTWRVMVGRRGAGRPRSVGKVAEPASAYILSKGGRLYWRNTHRGLSSVPFP